MTFNLDEGRRNESLADEQIANDITNQLAVNRTILAQQIDAVSDSDVYQSQAAASRLRQPSTIGNRPVFNRSAVGYQPQITVLPIGMTMQANAVVSADRRYVRITCVPFFSHIKGVVQYNIQTGVTDQAETDAAFGGLPGFDPDGDGGGEDEPQGQELLVFVGGTTGVVTRTGSTANSLAVTLTPDATLDVGAGLGVVNAVTIVIGNPSEIFGPVTGSGTVTATAAGYAAGSFTVPP